MAHPTEDMELDDFMDVMRRSAEDFEDRWSRRLDLQADGPTSAAVTVWLSRWHEYFKKRLRGEDDDEGGPDDLD